MSWCCLTSDDERSAIKILGYAPLTTARSAIKILRRFHIFMRRTTISHFSFLISNFSFKRVFHPQSNGSTPHGLTQNPEPDNL